MARIAILHLPRSGGGPVCHPDDIRRRALGGTESATIHLARALGQRGHDVHVIYGGARVDDGPIRWHAGPDDSLFDLAIANRWARFFAGVRARRKVVWMHNTVTPMWSISKKDTVSILRYRPGAVVLSRYQWKRVSPLLPYSRKVLIRHGVAPLFTESRRLREPPRPVAIWASQPYRGLDWTLDVWKRDIAPHVPGGEFHIYEPGGLLRKGERGGGVVVKGSVPHHELAEALSAARVLLYPGHRNESFCLTAAEATCCGVPIVTRGLGCLGERVEHGNGVVARSRRDFAQAAIRVLTDDDHWSSLNARTRDHPDRRSWAERAPEWEAALLD